MKKSLTPYEQGVLWQEVEHFATKVKESARKQSVPETNAHFVELFKRVKKLKGVK